MKESKVLCTAPKCKFEAQSSVKCLFEHCRTVHNWRDIPCNFDQCNFIAFSSHSNLAHKVKFHSKHRKFTRKEYPCKWKHCISSFRFESDLKAHLRKFGFFDSFFFIKCVIKSISKNSQKRSLKMCVLPVPK